MLLIFFEEQDLLCVSLSRFVYCFISSLIGTWTHNLTLRGGNPSDAGREGEGKS